MLVDLYERLFLIFLDSDGPYHIHQITVQVTRQNIKIYSWRWALAATSRLHDAYQPNVK